MKNILLATSLVLVSGISFADKGDDPYGYAYHTPKVVSSYLKSVDQNSPTQGPGKCVSMFAPLVDDGVLDVRYALGYFDDSTGKELIRSRVNYGYSPALDISIYNTLKTQFTSRCRGDLNLCGFDVASNARGKSILQKSINIQGRKTLVRITLTHAAASGITERNKGELSAVQQQLTAQSDDNFFNGLKTADVIFYNGHSRNGGGPDFNPPVLNSQNKVNYDGYYEPKRIGIKRLLKTISESSNKGAILGLFSCYSQKHFLKDLMNNNSQQRVILTADTIDYFDTLKASVGYLEGILRGTCGQELANTAKQNDKVRGGFQGFQLN